MLFNSFVFFAAPPEPPVLYFENFDLTRIQTTLRVSRFNNLLMESGYDAAKTWFLIDGFQHGFDLGYCGPTNRRDSSNNLPLKGVGDRFDLWNKIMKEVQLKRYAGPFSEIPFEFYMQSPIGLVPKGIDQTRLIFHLSYDFKGEKSFNYHTPDHLCKVKYRDLDFAVRYCLRIWKTQPSALIWMGIADLKSAFRIVPGRPDQWPFLMMKASHPISGKTFYFTDKNMPFGGSISCSLYTAFSNALAHVISHYTGTQMRIVNYLDDFLFIAVSESQCNDMVRTFIRISEFLGIPMATDKIVWASTEVKFLGIILNGRHRYLQIPNNKRDKAIVLLGNVLRKRTITVQNVQELTGLLNFLAKVVVPGRTFTRRMYAKISTKTKKLQQHHHISVDSEFKSDASIWLRFLEMTKQQPHLMCRPFIDLNDTLVADELDLYTDSSANVNLGFAGVFMNRWFFGQWEPGYIKRINPSIQYLELYAVCMAIFVWSDYFSNTRLILHCDNKAVVEYVEFHQFWLSTLYGFIAEINDKMHYQQHSSFCSPCFE